MTKAPLCLADIDALRHKLRHGPAVLRQRWEHMLWLAAQTDLAPNLAPNLRIGTTGIERLDERTYAFLAYAVTGDRVYVQAARRTILRVVDSIPERATTDLLQLHTWCDAFPMGRWMVLYDWVADSEVFSDADRARIAEGFVDYLYSYVYPCLLGRHVEGAACNNQNSSMAFACLAGGALFGQRRGQDPRCDELRRLGADHLVRFLTSFPRGGYSFEGSTYMGSVNACLMPLAVELIRSLTGQDLWDVRWDASCASVAESFGAIMRLWMPGNLMLPWDNYGFQVAYFMPAAAYYARRTGDGVVFAQMEKAGVWGQLSDMGWGYDKNLWSTVFWPDTDVVDDRLQRYAEPRIGAGYTGPEGRLFAYQYWDKSHALPMRAQFNPNHLGLSLDGRPLLLDGACVSDSKSASFTGSAYMRMRMDKQQMINIGLGTVGAHNCLVLDGDEAYASKHDTEGELTGVAWAVDAGYFESDVTACYAERYDVTRVRRGTLVVGDAWTLVRDVVEASMPHEVWWRAHLRQGDITITDGQIYLRSEDGNRLDIVHASTEPVRHRSFPELGETPLPHQITQGCHEVTMVYEGNALVLYTLLVARSELQPLRQLEQWERGWFAEVPATLPAGGQVISQIGEPFYGDGEHRPGVVVLTCAFDMDAIPAAPVYLEVDGMVRGCTAWLNGHCFNLSVPPNYKRLLAPRVAVGDVLRTGPNLLQLVVPTTLEGAIHGPVRLLQEQRIDSMPSLTVTSDRELTVRVDDRKWQVTWADTVRVCEGSRCQTLVPDLPAPARADAIVCTSGAVITKLSQGDPATASPNDDALVAAIAGDDWKQAWRALTVASHDPSPGVAQAALDLLRREIAEHPTPFKREPADEIWYRLKAGACRVLGSAGLVEAIPLLAGILHSDDIYRARVAAAEGLRRIGTPEALAELASIDESDEGNVWLTARQYLHASRAGTRV